MKHFPTAFKQSARSFCVQKRFFYDVIGMQNLNFQIKALIKMIFALA
jgi:hypothetical protein